MHNEVVVTTVIVIVALLLVAAAAAVGLKRANLPYTVGLVLIGLGLGVLADRVEAFQVLGEVALSPEIILFVFLPTLIFESAFKLDARMLSRNLAPVLTLAAPGLLLSTAVVGGLVAWLTPLTLGPALLFGALISATDPVAVIALFQELGAPKRLAILVEGESLFNDATAIVLFRILLPLATGTVFTWAVVGSGAFSFTVVFVGGLVVGGAIGYVMIRSIAIADDDPLVEVALSTVVAYAAFIAAEHYLHVSGVMATVGAGVVVGTLGSTRFTPHVREYLTQFWEYAAFVANSLIFLLVGLSIPIAMLTSNIVPILIAVLAVLVARAATVLGFVPLLSRLPRSEPIDWRYQSMLFWGGLRGAVALALALSLPAAFPGRALIVSLTIGVVLFTILGGGLTIGPLMHLLKLDEPGLAQRIAEAQAAVAAKQEALSRIERMSTTGHFSNRLAQQLRAAYHEQLADAHGRLVQLRERSTDMELQGVLWSEALAVEQRAYRSLFDRGVISEAVARELQLGIEVQRDAVKTGRAPRGIPMATPLEMRLTGWLMDWLVRVAPKSAIAQRHRLRLLAAKYEHDSAIVEASHRVTQEGEHLLGLAEGREHLVEEVRDEYGRRSQEAIERIDTVAEHFPEFARAVQEQTARRMAMDGEADAVEHLAAAGVIPSSVARDARRAAERSVRRFAQQPIAELAPRPEELLSRVPFFTNLSPNDFTRVVHTLIPRTVLAGETMIRQGERGRSLFLIARGVVAVLVTPDGGPSRRVASLHAGDFFGEMALLTDEPRSATVRAATDCQLYELSKRDVDTLCEVCQGVKDALVQAFRERKR